ncbi:MAG: amidohydrolase, partial [Acidobacteria bacterium]|nr:amidohydrolase [Acidobacteriota bacterium]
LVLKNGRIWTGAERPPWAESLAIRGNRIARVGSNAQVASAMGPKTTVLDLGGKLVLPGFNDAHIHFLTGALRRFEVNLTGARTLAEIQQRIAAFAKAHPEAPWITGAGWEYYCFPGHRLPRREDLDAVVKNRPAFLRAYDGHTGWANTKALEVAGLRRDAKFDGFGEIVLDPKTGEPSGALKEGAQSLVRSKIPRPSREKQWQALLEAMQLAASLGITSIQNASGDPGELGLYEELAKTGHLTLRTSVAMLAVPQTKPDDIRLFRSLKEKHRGPLLRAGAVKFMLDGVIESHTAAMLEPYSDEPSTSGAPAWRPGAFNDMVARADAAGLQVYCHAIGDRAVRLALDAFERALRLNGPHDARFRIEHIETVGPADLPRFAQLGVMASMEPIHAYPDSVEVWSRAVGPQRLPYAFAWRSLEQAGARLVFSSDWPASLSVDPIRGIHNAVNRRTTAGDPPGGWVPEQRVSLETALRAYTTQGAYASFEEDRKGTLEEGKLADLVVLTQDLFHIDPLDIHQTKAALTIMDGRVVYRRSDLRQDTCLPAEKPEAGHTKGA